MHFYIKCSALTNKQNINAMDCIKFVETNTCSTKYYLLFSHSYKLHKIDFSSLTGIIVSEVIDKLVQLKFSSCFS